MTVMNQEEPSSPVVSRTMVRAISRALGPVRTRHSVYAVSLSFTSAR